MPIYPISLCMIVRNEERFLRDCLASVQGVVDEICIADSGSTDGTIAIAESFGARITHITWRDDFAWARNQALAMATQPWIFVLDADERLAPQSRDELKALRGVAPDGLGRWIRCRNFSDAKFQLVASTNAIVRIFPSDPNVRYRGALHEYVSRGNDPVPLDARPSGIEIHHHGYLPEVMAEREKGNRNLRVAEAEFAVAPDDPLRVFNYAMAAMLAGRRDLAREQLYRVRELTKTSPRAFRPMALATLAGVLIEEHRYAEALEIADECVAILATLPDGHFARGRALARLGRNEEARAAYGKAIETGSTGTFEHFVVDDAIANWKAHNEIGGTLVMEGRFAEALQWLDLGLRNRPSERTMILNRARCYEGLGDLENALIGFRAVFEVDRDESSALEYVNFVFRHGSPDVCLMAVEQALPAAGPDYQRAFLTSAAGSMLRAGRRDEARALLERAVAVGGDRAVGLAMIDALAKHNGLPELNVLLAAPGDPT